VAAGNRKGLKGRLALAGWGLAGMLLAADFFMGGYPAADSMSGRNDAEAAAMAAGGNGIEKKEQEEEKYIALTFDEEVIIGINGNVPPFWILG